MVVVGFGGWAGVWWYVWCTVVGVVCDGRVVCGGRGGRDGVWWKVCSVVVVAVKRSHAVKYDQSSMTNHLEVSNLSEICKFFQWVAT